MTQKHFSTNSKITALVLIIDYRDDTASGFRRRTYA